MYELKTQTIDNNLDRTVFRASDGASCIDIETSVLTTDSGEDVEQARQNYQHGLFDGQIVNPSELPTDSLVVHRTKPDSPNCLGDDTADEYVVLVSRSNVLSVSLVFSVGAASEQQATSLGNKLAQRIEVALKN